ncbi:hypothetical protein [Lysobacter capsici]|uniref:hypothetical protein n=1 Tax=Lysobacter capsici TaxID=435897 RepID=UPI00287BA2A4|nr:hypothetical protein [Lysobacter capsici]WND82426.1 hypothetical protein RJ610_08775 [Lysobacter capsici]WND87622.1 hypothetical protein RJ609_08780 [Lysobacter capsici]
MVTFLLSLLTKESNSAACGRKLLILPLASKALELQSFKASKLQSFEAFEAFKAASRIKSVPPLKRRVTFFCLKQQKKGNQRKMLFCESRARAIGADAGTRHTGHPCPGGARRASMRVALRVSFCSREIVTSQRWVDCANLGLSKSWARQA